MNSQFVFFKQIQTWKEDENPVDTASEQEGEMIDSDFSR